MPLFPHLLRGTDTFFLTRHPSVAFFEHSSRPRDPSATIQGTCLDPIPSNEAVLAIGVELTRFPSRVAGEGTLNCEPCLVSPA